MNKAERFCELCGGYLGESGDVDVHTACADQENAIADLAPDPTDIVRQHLKAIIETAGLPEEIYGKRPEKAGAE